MSKVPNGIHVLLGSVVIAATIGSSATPGVSDELRGATQRISTGDADGVNESIFFACAKKILPTLPTYEIGKKGFC